jgi:hypothetical protein
MKLSVEIEWQGVGNNRVVIDQDGYLIDLGTDTALQVAKAIEQAAKVARRANAAESESRGWKVAWDI